MRTTRQNCYRIVRTFLKFLPGLASVKDGVLAQREHERAQENKMHNENILMQNINPFCNLAVALALLLQLHIRNCGLIWHLVGSNGSQSRFFADICFGKSRSKLKQAFGPQGAMMDSHTLSLTACAWRLLAFC